MDKYISKGSDCASDKDKASEHDNSCLGACNSSRASLKSSFGARVDYFKIRNQKIRKQAPKAKTAVLRGVTVYFTGCASHSQLELSRLVWENGGVVAANWSRHAVTHVIADRLAASKAEKELSVLGQSKAWRGAIVRPEWLLDSIHRKKILPTYEFRIVRGHTDDIARLMANAAD